jgi:hypothetical protein
MVRRDGVEPSTLAFSGLAKAAKRMVLKNSREDEGTPRNGYSSYTVPSQRSVGFSKFTSRTDWLRRFR